MDERRAAILELLSGKAAVDQVAFYFGVQPRGVERGGSLGGDGPTELTTASRCREGLAPIAPLVESTGPPEAINMWLAQYNHRRPHQALEWEILP